MKDFKGEELEIGDRIAVYREKSMVEGIVVGFTASKLNVRYKILFHPRSHRVGQIEASQNPAKTILIEHGTGLPKISDEHAASAIDQLRELL